jgi:hypothetical protein
MLRSPAWRRISTASRSWQASCNADRAEAITMLARHGGIGIDLPD